MNREGHANQVIRSNKNMNTIAGQFHRMNEEPRPDACAFPECQEYPAERLSTKIAGMRC